MTQREKSLLSALLVIALLAGVLIIYRVVYQPRYTEATSRLASAQQQIQTAQVIRETQDLIADEQKWLAQHEPDAISQQDAQSQLQNLCESMAQRNGLEVKSQSLLPAVTPEGSFYHRARMDLLVMGTEKSFYNWIFSLDSPERFQRVTFLRLYPNKSDDTKLEAKVVVEKWFVPATN